MLRAAGDAEVVPAFLRHASGGWTGEQQIGPWGAEKIGGGDRRFLRVHESLLLYTHITNRQAPPTLFLRENAVNYLL